MQAIKALYLRFPRIRCVCTLCRVAASARRVHMCWISNEDRPRHDCAAPRSKSAPTRPSLLRGELVSRGHDPHSRPKSGVLLLSPPFPLFCPISPLLVSRIPIFVSSSPFLVCHSVPRASGTLATTHLVLLPRGAPTRACGLDFWDSWWGNRAARVARRPCFR